MQRHEYYEELCALAASGQLSEKEERHRLKRLNSIPRVPTGLTPRLPIDFSSFPLPIPLNLKASSGIVVLLAPDGSYQGCPSSLQAR